MTQKPIPYGRQNITEEDIQAVVETLKSDFLTQGPQITAFETEFAQYVGADYAVAINNATSGLHLAAVALGVQPGDKVIVTPLTFAASANCIRYCGGEVVFCDIDKDTYLMDLEKVRQLLESSPKGTYKGIVPVDFAGYPLEMEAFRKLADEYKLWMIEDACHAPGAYYSDQQGNKQFSGNGRFAEASIFSFHPVKHIATGEGGMITTNNKALYEKLRLFRTHGITKDPQSLYEHHGGWYYEMQELGFNYRITDFQAALGISQLKRANAGLKRRQEIAQRYNEAFSDIADIKTPYTAQNVYHAYHLYVIQVENRLDLYNHLHKNNIFAQVHYVPLHTMPYYQPFGNKKGDHPVVEAYYEHCLSLPMYPTLTQEEQEYIIKTILSWINQK
jgi:UDP-4-amino-4,6-dideoxy-N-acetyl-beta-L-altrosamine transaminase